jgi:hypothetical protein
MHVVGEGAIDFFRDVQFRFGKRSRLAGRIA